MGKKYSDLDSATSIYNNDLACLAQEVQEGETSETGYISRKTTVSALASKILKEIQFTTDLANYPNQTVLGAIGKIITGTLVSGSTSLILSDASITADSIVEDVFVPDTYYGVNPTNILVATGSVTLTFPVQSNDLPVKVRIL